MQIGALRQTKLDEFISKNGIHILGDGGYHHGNILVPKDLQGKERATQNFLRGVVEIFFGLVQVFKIAKYQFSGSPSQQTLVLSIVYELAARIIERHPIRPQLLKLQSNLPSSCRPVASAAELDLFNHFIDKISE